MLLRLLSCWLVSALKVLLLPLGVLLNAKHVLQVLALPLSCDASMPDYIVKADVFEKGMKRHWHQRDRFRMFFATSYAHKAG